MSDNIVNEFAIKQTEFIDKISFLLISDLFVNKNELARGKLIDLMCYIGGFNEYNSSKLINAVNSFEYDEYTKLLLSDAETKKIMLELKAFIIDFKIIF